MFLLLQHGLFRATKNGPNIFRESKEDVIWLALSNVSLLRLTKDKNVCFFIIFIIIILISMMMNVILFMKILSLFVISKRN